MQIANYSLFKSVSSDFRELLGQNGFYICALFKEDVQEERNQHFKHTNKDLNDLELITITEDSISGKITINDKEIKTENDFTEVFSIVSRKTNPRIYLDITGFSHSLWAPLLKKFLEGEFEISVIYVEPDQYKKISGPIEGDIFDLSEKIKGIHPIPSFKSLSINDEDFLLFALLGFEGPRFKYMLEKIDPPNQNIYPIIGVPGFKAEYPFHTYNGNRLPLMETRSWRNLSYAAASCPFDLYLNLKNQHEKFPDFQVKIALLGTKPHALGAILYRLVNPSNCEIIYDHPIKKNQRTSGISKKYIYDVSGFLQAQLGPGNKIQRGRLR